MTQITQISGYSCYPQMTQITQISEEGWNCIRQGCFWSKVVGR